ncbi:hypothetical protein LINPERHAP1_LOCUS35643 [Linum perenne]
MCTPPPYLNGRNDQSSKGRSEDLSLSASCSYQHVDGDRDVKQGSIRMHFELLKKLADEWAAIGPSSIQVNTMQLIQRGDTIMDDEVIMNLIGQPMLSQDVQDKETNWPELKFQASKLMEENLWYQAELARRNVEKKVTIDRLQLQVEHLKRQNTALLDCVSFFKMGKKPRRSSTSKLHQLWDKLFRKDQ